jgi:hypothetical protein
MSEMFGDVIEVIDRVTGEVEGNCVGFAKIPFEKVCEIRNKIC